MSEFLAANLQASRHSSKENIFAALELAQQETRRPTDEPMRYHMGLGWRVEVDTGTRLKSGSMDGFESNMLINAEKNIALVVMSNSYVDAPNDVDTLSSEIFEFMMHM